MGTCVKNETKIFTYQPNQTKPYLPILFLSFFALLFSFDSIPIPFPCLICRIFLQKKMVTVEPASSHIGIMKNETFFDLDTLFPKTLVDLDSPFRTGIFMLLFVFTLVLASSSSKRKKAAEIFFHPIEFVALVQYLTFYANAKIPKQCTPNELYCYQTLKKVSRSFSAVILELCEELRMAICIFYLVLRGLDTIEDDMSIDLNKKVAMLKEFASHLDQAGWNSREGCKV